MNQVPGTEPSQPAPVAECMWCEDRDSGRSRWALPHAFCWTRMQAEAGQPLELILWRKELERAAGGGLFFWGVGNSVGRRVVDLLRHVSTPKVLFSQMKSKPRREDASPDGVLLWRAYGDLSGRVRALPEHALVLSRASTRLGPKSRHYALACRSHSCLVPNPAGRIQLGHFRNLASTNPRIGASQVTAVIQHTPGPLHGPTYEVDLVADLSDPYFIELRDPVGLSSFDAAYLKGVIAGVRDREAWMDVVREMNRRAGPSREPALVPDCP